MYDYCKKKKKKVVRKNIEIDLYKNKLYKNKRDNKTIKVIYNSIP